MVTDNSASASHGLNQRRIIMSKNLTIFMLNSVLVGSLLAPALSHAMGMGSAPEKISMTAELWDVDGKATFTQKQGYPQGLMSIKGAGAVLRNRNFDNGTIEFDINEDADSQGFTGIWFHQHGPEKAENFYLRTEENCPGSVECIQYAPISHGNMQWDVYPEYQRGAPVHAHGWNHVKLVISGKRMNVYINRETTPSLQVGQLEGDYATGAIQLRGDATYANLILTPDATEGLAAEPVKDPTDAGPRFVRHWLVSPATTLESGGEAKFADMPDTGVNWEDISAERKGYVNLSRNYGTGSGTPDLIWLKTKINSTQIQTKHVALGWARQVWIFVNGKPVYADKNYYYPAEARKSPMGRMALENGGFDLPLQNGANEVEIAVSNDQPGKHYGWGFEFRFDDIEGLSLQKARASM